MSYSSLHAPIAHLSDRLETARHGRFVGRMAELTTFRSAVLAAEPPFAILHLSGPGGVGKSALLREFARIATECGRPVVQIDGRTIDPAPRAFLGALEQASGYALQPAEMLPPGAILLVDAYEALLPLDAWLRDTFLLGLPGRSLVVLAGRAAPAPDWRCDLEWGALTRTIALRNFDRQESETYLTTRGIPTAQQDGVLAFAHGHPLALALAADALASGDRLAGFQPRDEPDVVRALLERLVDDIPSPVHRRALDVCVLAWATTEALLEDVLEIPDARELFTWLRGLSFIESRPDGLAPHDLAREAMDADMHWRNPESALQLSRRLSATLYAKMQQPGHLARQRVWFDLLHLHRHDPLYQPYYDWDALGDSYAMPATPEDHDVMLAMVRKHQGEAEAQIAMHWLERQPGAFLVYRDQSGEVFGFMAMISLHHASADDACVDPAVRSAQAFMERYGAARPGEEAVHHRFWMHREAYQGASAAINLTAINSSMYWTTHPRLAWSFITVSDPSFLEEHFASIHMWRAPEADFVVEDRSYAIFAHDWRLEPIADWLVVKAEPKAVPLHHQWPLVSPVSPRKVLSQAEFAAAVRDALRHFTRSDLLAENPLARARVVASSAEPEAAPAALRALLREAIATLETNPRDAKLHRALWHTYIEPAPTQEAAAELLGLPFNTYRYHLARGIERVTESLWQQELGEGGS